MRTNNQIYIDHSIDHSSYMDQKGQPYYSASNS